MGLDLILVDRLPETLRFYGKTQRVLRSRDSFINKKGLIRCELLKGFNRKLTLQDMV